MTNSDTPEQSGPRLELKHTVVAGAVPALVTWLGERFDPDPHAKDPADPRMLVESIYYDTAERLCYRGRAKVQLPKHRLRRYDGKAEWFLEEKLRLDSSVWKRRLSIGPKELAEVLESGAPLQGPLEWFRARFRVLGLAPIIHVSYDRFAFVTANGERVTIDQQIAAAPLEPTIDASTSQHPFGIDRKLTPITNTAILEVKGPAKRTPLMDEVVAYLATEEQSYSKYSLGLEAVGLETASLKSTEVKESES